jgi:hypothetical protein
MKGKKKLELILVSFVVTIFLAGFIHCSAMAAEYKSPDLNGDRAKI